MTNNYSRDKLVCLTYCFCEIGRVKSSGTRRSAWVLWCSSVQKRSHNSTAVVYLGMCCWLRWRTPTDERKSWPRVGEGKGPLDSWNHSANLLYQRTYVSIQEKQNTITKTCTKLSKQRNRILQIYDYNKCKTYKSCYQSNMSKF